MKRALIEVMRWVGVVPAFLVGFLLGGLFVRLNACQQGEMFVITDMADRGGFGGHYIMGPILSIFDGAASGGLALAFAVSTAPRARVPLAYIIVGVVLTVEVSFLALCSYAVYAESLAIEPLIRLVVTNGALIVATFATAAFFVQHEREQVREHYYRRTPDP